MSNVRPLPPMDHAALAALLPTCKSETEKAAALVAIGMPDVEPVLPQIVEWLQDLNWPVAQVFQPFLARIGAPLAPHIRAVLAGSDDIWKYSVLFSVVQKSVELARVLRPEIERLASHPTLDEQTEGVTEVAGQVLWGMQHEPEA